MASATDLRLDTLAKWSLVMVGLGIYNWTQQTDWCYISSYHFSDFKTSWAFLADCVAPYSMEFMWAGLCGLVLFSSAKLTLRYGWLESLPPSKESDKGVAVLDEGSPAKTLKRVPKSREHVNMLMLVVGITVGVSQAVGNNVYFITEVYGDTFFGLLLKHGLFSSNILRIPHGWMPATGSFLFSKMLGSYRASHMWDRHAQNPEERRKLVVSIPATLAASQLLLGVGPYFTRDSSVLIVGLCCAGWSLGAMTVMVPILALEW